MTDAGPAGDGSCQAQWLAAVMWSAGAVLDVIGPCPEHSEYRVVMRLSELGYAAVFEVSVCHDHHEHLRRSPYHVSSGVLGE